VRNILAGSHTEHRWRCSLTVTEREWPFLLRKVTSICCRFCNSCVFLGTQFCFVISLSLRDSSFFCSLARRQPGGGSSAMGLSFQGKGTRPGSCFSFSFLVEFWGFCCETLMDVRCRKTDSFLSFFFLAEFWFDPDGAF
jgi:hypothetical protein